MLDPQTGSIRLTSKSRFAEGSDVLKAARWVMGRVINNLQIPDCMEIRHSGRCGKCGKTLTEPKSLDCGLGPCCRKMLGYAD